MVLLDQDKVRQWPVGHFTKKRKTRCNIHYTVPTLSLCISFQICSCILTVQSNSIEEVKNEDDLFVVLHTPQFFTEGIKNVDETLAEDCRFEQ